MFFVRKDMTRKDVYAVNVSLIILISVSAQGFHYKLLTYSSFPSGEEFSNPSTNIVFEVQVTVHREEFI